MIDKLVTAFVENLWLIIAMLFAVGFYAFLQAIISTLRDYFMVKIFKKKMNGNNKTNGQVEAKLDELITINTGIKENTDCLPDVNKKSEEMHGIVCETDENKFPKIRVMEKKVKEMWNKVIKGNGL